MRPFLGVNVVLDFIGADYLQQNIDVLKTDGENYLLQINISELTTHCRYVGGTWIFGRYRGTELQHAPYFIKTFNR